jgi:hypothetical protein
MNRRDAEMKAMPSVIERLGFKTFYTDFWFRKPMASR